MIARYEYDGLGRRVKKHLNTDADDDFDEFRHFYYNANWQVLETRKSTSENTAPQTLQPEVQYVWSLRYIDAAVRRDENTDANDLCDDETLYYLNDANMNVTALVDTGGDAVERYVYDPYGNCTVYNSDWSATVAWADSKKNTIRYCGYYFDNETGLYHVRHRSYHPTLGRWMQRDPIGYADGMSLYEYVGSNPAVDLDPMGLYWKETGGRQASDIGIDVKRNPDHTWLEFEEVAPPYDEELGDDVGFPFDRKGKAEQSWDMPIDRTSRRQMLAGKGIGKTCDCVTASDVFSCIVVVRKDPMWDDEKNFSYLFRNCRDFVRDVARRCCLLLPWQMKFDTDLLLPKLGRPPVPSGAGGKGASGKGTPRGPSGGGGW